MVVALGAIGTQPLFARPSYEMALATGLLVPSAVALCTAWEVAAAPMPAPQAYARGLYNGGGLAALAFVVALVHGLRAGFCDLSTGGALFALGPAMGCLLAGVWGAATAELARYLPLRPSRIPKLTLLLALLGPLGTALFQLWCFYVTPMIFAYDPYVGYFSGAIFDTVLSYRPLLHYRAASLATLFSAYALAQHLERDEDQRLRFRMPAQKGLLLVGAVAALASAASVAYGPRLDHWHTRTSIAEQLGGQLREGRCLLLYDITLERRHVQLLARDCHQQVLSIERQLGGGDGRQVVAFVFRNTDEKRRLMGAAHTSVAKPWRHEIYLHDKPYPHRPLRHELVHVLAGAFARGPFEIAGSWGGWLPDPGLIEGIAEATAPRDDNLSAHQWAAAMRRVEVLPRMQPLLSLAFFGNHSSTSYLAAGSFVAWVRDTFGTEVLRAWYGGASLTTISGRSWSQLEQQWWAMLDGISLGAAELATAKRRFDRPSLFRRRCPHVVDALLRQAGGRVNGGDVAGAQQRFERVLMLDKGNLNAMFGLARCYDRLDHEADSEAALTAISTDKRLTAASRMHAIERLGDLRLRAGDAQQARALYRQVLPLVTAEGRLRTLALKIHYADDGLARAALVALLIGSDGRGANNIEALDLMGRWRAQRPHDPVPDYLFARQHLAAERYALAEAALARVITKPVTLPRVRAEALRMRVVASCAMGHWQQAEQSLAQYSALAETSDQRRRLLGAVVKRCKAASVR